MSTILKALLIPQIATVVNENSQIQAADVGSVAAQRTKLINDLAEAIAVAVQQYLLQNVTVIPGQVVAITSTGLITQTGGGTTVSPGLLNAP